MTEPHPPAAAVPSAAEYDMRRRQTSAPPWADLPWSPADGVIRATPKALIEMLPAADRLAFEKTMHGRCFCCFELGVPAPNAETEGYDDGSVGIRVNSGLIDFIYCVTRALWRGTSRTSQDERRPAAAGLDEVGDELGRIYEQWRGGALWRGERLRVAGDFSLDDISGKYAEMLARNALLFFVCHEMGHAALHADILPDERTTAQEHEADAYAMKLAILGYAKAIGNERMAIAGAIVAIRALVALAVIGHRFPGIHPPPRERLARLRRTVRQMAPADETYYHFTTIAYATEEQMSATELRIRGLPGPTTLTAERMVSRLYAAIEEIIRGRRGLDEMRVMFTRDVEAASPAVLARAGAIAMRVFATTSPSYGFGPWTSGGKMFRQRMTTFDALRTGLPPGVRSAFEAANQGDASHAGT